MKLRIEQSGLHYFDRNTGLHFLVDEIVPSVEEYSLAPRTFSIAITNDCNANCPFCHIPKGNDYLSKEFILDFCKKIDELGSLDIAFGGGEPLLHPAIVEICKAIWDNTKLGISITTNGQLLTESLIDNLSGHVSFIRISIDSVDTNTYRRIRSFDFLTLKHNLLKIKNKIPFGIKMVVNEQTISELDEIFNFAQIMGAEELLLLPMIENGKIKLKRTELKILETWIQNNHEKFPIRILEQARKEINIPVLFDDDSFYSDYLYLSARKSLQNNSYEKSNGQKLNIDNIENILKKWRIKSMLCNTAYK